MKHSGGCGGHSGGVVDIWGREVYHSGGVGGNTGGLAKRSVAVVGRFDGLVGLSGGVVKRSGGVVKHSGGLVMLPRIRICEVGLGGAKISKGSTCALACRFRRPRRKMGSVQILTEESAPAG